MTAGQRQWPARLKRILLLLVIVYACICGGVAGCQRRLLYFPQAYTLAVAENLAAREGFTPWRNASGQLIGWQIPAKNPTNTATVLILHGNAGSALGRGYLAKPIHEASSAHVCIVEYPGYGPRPGQPSLKTILAAAEEAFTALTNQGPVLVVSESIGTGPAAHLARKFPERVAGMMLFVPYDSLPSVAQHQMSWLPAYVLLRDRFEPADWLEAYRGPIRVMLAEEDEVIPAKFGRRLFDRLQGPKELQVLPNAGHNDAAGQSADWWRSTFEFWSGYKNSRP